MANVSTSGATDDQRVLDGLLAQVASTLGVMVTTLLQQGRAFGTIGALFERAFDGKVSGGCGHRAEVARRVSTDPRFPEAVRGVLLEALQSPSELPIVLVVDRGEGLVAVGVRRERGELVSLS
jgi:hypothetical protein